MGAEQNSREVSIADYLLKNHSRLFEGMGDNPYWRREKAGKIVKELLEEQIVYRENVLTTDAQTQKDIDEAIKDLYPQEKVRKARSARVSLHSIFTKVVQEELGYKGKELFNVTNELRKRFVGDGVIQECCVATGEGKSRRYKITDSERLENRVKQLVGEDKGLKSRRKEVQAIRLEAKEKTTFLLSNKDIDIYSTDLYSKGEALKILQLVHRDIFSEIRVNKILNKLGDNGKLKGESLVDIINKTNGIMVLSSRSVQLKLENKVSLSYDEISKYLERVSCSKYVHTFEGVIDGPYVLIHELDDLCQTIGALSISSQTSVIDSPKKLAREVDDELTRVLSETRAILREDGKCPEGKVRSKLLEAGILSENSVESIQATYNDFAGAMDGFYFFDFNILRERMRLGWAEFKEGPMKHLIELGIVKDVVESLGYGEAGVNLYVLAQGKRDEMHKILKLD